MSNESGRSNGPEQKRALIHDLRHSLFALRTGIGLLPQIREDIEKFTEVQTVLQAEARKASGLLQQLLESQADTER